jgi:hypothetical protein
MTSRRFPSPWIVEELDACFVVTDGAGQKLAYVYFEDEPGRRSAAKLLSKDEAREGSAANIAKLPELLFASCFAYVGCPIGTVRARCTVVVHYVLAKKTTRHFNQ